MTVSMRKVAEHRPVGSNFRLVRQVRMNALSAPGGNSKNLLPDLAFCLKCVALTKFDGRGSTSLALRLQYDCNLEHVV